MLSSSTVFGFDATFNARCSGDSTMTIGLRLDLTRAYVGRL